MQRMKQSYAKGPAGVANVVVDTTKELVRISFISGDNASESFKIDLDSAPETVKTGRFYVGLSSKSDSIYSIYPAVGTFVAKFAHWAAKENTVPTPQEKVGKFGPYSYMVAILKIVKGDKKGMEVPLFLNYKFVDDGQGNVAIPTSDKSGTAAERLINFLDATGTMDETIPFSENILPALAKRILKHDQPFSIVMKEGKIDYISSLEGVTIEADPDDPEPEPDDPEDDPEEDEHAPDPEPASKSSGAKGKKIRPDLEEE